MLAPMAVPRLARFASLLVLATPLWAACEPRVSLEECVDEASCPAELTCRYGRCRAVCTESLECATGEICIGEPGVCTLPTDNCAQACASGLVCAAARCTLACVSSADCRDGTVCQSFAGVRACLPGETADAGMDAAPGVDASDGGEDVLEVDALVLTDAVEAADANVAIDAAVASDAAALDAPSRMDAPDAAATEPLPRQLSAGFGHACAIRAGRVYCWGNNDANQLGDGLTPSSRRSHSGLCGGHDCAPAPMEPVRRRMGTGVTEMTGVTTLASGHHTTCGLTTSGIVYCWGSPENGYELGHDGWGTVGEPTIAGDATEIAVGLRHGCARVSGRWACWGMNEATVGGTLVESGVLGSDGASTTVARTAERFDTAEIVGAGGAYTCTAYADRVACFGMNYSGEIGLEEARVVPMGRDILGLAHPVEALHAMGHSVCALAGGDVSCWGSDDSSILASRTLPPVCETWAVYGYRCRVTAEPVNREVELRTERFVGLSTGLSSSACAIAGTDRSVVCWGANQLGQAGVTSGATMVGILAEPVTLEADGSRLVDVAEVACGAAFCCARTMTDRVYCWGENDLGQLGNGTTDSESFDADVPDGGPTVAVGHPRAVEVVFP